MGGIRGQPICMPQADGEWGRARVESVKGVRRGGGDNWWWCVCDAHSESEARNI